MKITITGRNLELTDSIKEAVEKKLSKYFTPETEVQVTLSVEKERQLKYRKKLIDQQQNAIQDFNREYLEAQEEDDEPEEAIRIVRTKRFGMKPMYPEDVCIQMEPTEHDFFVFYNAVANVDSLTVTFLTFDCMA